VWVTVGYLAAEGYEQQLVDELAHAGVRVSRRHHRLAVADDLVDAAWALNTWLDVDMVEIDSIGHAARVLRHRQRNWAAYLPSLRGRGELITERLPHVSAKPLSLGEAPPSAPLGSWTLLEPQLLALSARCSSAFPNGEARFVERPDGPPSRAYLKLWEAFARLRRWPGPGDRCLDLGASPGGWTWTLAELGAAVVAVDRAPLDPVVSRLDRVEWREGSAFALEPSSFGRVDWLCSDIVAYPTRVRSLVERWLQSGRVRNLIVTVKFQGETDHDAARSFAAIPGGQLFHLAHNRHELTFAATDLDRSPAH
jgi:23S rRNA (cytidine2498-2'-O)-methyltransferase